MEQEKMSKKVQLPIKNVTKKAARRRGIAVTG
jgi:hypothetical protein